MKNINPNQLEQALTMYKETVSPSKDNLIAILSQIPERKTHQDGRAVRSPYIWLAVTEIMMLCSIVVVVLPTLAKILNDPFYQIDKQVELFEMRIQHQDNQDDLINSTL